MLVKFEIVVLYLKLVLIWRLNDIHGAQAGKRPELCLQSCLSSTQQKRALTAPKTISDSDFAPWFVVPCLTSMNECYTLDFQQTE